MRGPNLGKSVLIFVPAIPSSEMLDSHNPTPTKSSMTPDVTNPRHYSPVKILQNRNNILSFRQNENEHVAMAWDRIKLMLRTCPSHGVNEWTILHSFYNGLNYMSRNILDSAAGGAFMGKTIVEEHIGNHFAKL